MSSNETIIALDVGEKRIGVAQGRPSIGIAVPYETIEVDGREVETIAQLVLQAGAKQLVVGYPRNQSGETTEQTQSVERFVEKLRDIDVKIIYQDESLTSVLAEQQLQASGRPYTKADVDMLAASLILEDYLETQR